MDTRYSSGIHPVFGTYKRTFMKGETVFSMWVRNSDSPFFRNIDHFILDNSYARYLTWMTRQGRMPTPLYGKLLIMLWNGDEEMYNLAKILIDEYEKEEFAPDTLKGERGEVCQEED